MELYEFCWTMCRLWACSTLHFPALAALSEYDSAQWSW